MDALDVRLLRVLTVRPYGTPAAPDALQPTQIAARLGVKVDTVKARLRRLRELGVLRGFQAVPDLAHLGRKASAYMVQVPEGRKDAAVARILDSCEVMELRDFLGGYLSIDFAYTGERHLVQQLGVIADEAGAEPVWYYDRDTVLGRRAPSALGWRLIQALRGNGRGRPEEIAQKLGVTPRTVRRERQRLLTDGSLYIVPTLDFSQAEGILCCEMLLRLHEGGGPPLMRALARLFDDHLLHAYVPADGGVWNYSVLLVAKTSAEIGALGRRALGSPAVERAEPLFFRRFVEAGAWLDKLIAAHVRNHRKPSR